MKKLIAVVLAIMLAGCANTPPEEATGQKQQNFTTVCQYISGEMTGAENGWYEIMRHTDGSADILFTDIATATRTPASLQAKLDTPYGSLGGIFVSDGYVYYYHYGFPQGMNKTETPSCIYQYSTDGSLIQSAELEDIHFTLNSAVVSDGEKLYFAAGHNSKTCIYAVTAAGLECEKIYETEGSFTIAGSYSGGLVLFVTKGRTRQMESLDLGTMERKTLFETRYPWHMLDDGTLYCRQEENGVLNIYDTKTNTASSIKLFDKDDCVNSWQVQPAGRSGYIMIYTSQYDGNYEKSYVYDLADDRLTEVPQLYGKIKSAYHDGKLWCIAPAQQIRVYLNSRLTERVDWQYVIMPMEDYISTNYTATAVTNKIDYR